MFLKRYEKQEKRTFGELFDKDGVKICDTLEDTDRGLTSKMTPEEVAKIKIYGKTAIPTGVYKLASFHSPKFKREVLRVLDVVGYTGILIHGGSTEEHTLGCILVGRRAGNILVNSRPALDKVVECFHILDDDVLLID